MKITITNLTRDNLSTDIALLAPGASSSMSISPDRGYLLATSLQALESAGKIRLLVQDDSTGSDKVEALTVGQYKSIGTSTVYVSSTGSNSNPGTLSAPFLTIQGALNSLPKYLKHKTIVQVGAGAFAGFMIQGFQFDYTDSLTIGDWLQVSGQLVTATLGQGTATGTATSGTAGTFFSSTWGTLTDTTNNWSVDALRGLLLEITGGTGATQIFPIHSNTATAITIAGAWTAPNGTSTYAIRDWATTINTTIPFPVSFATASPSNRAGVVVVGNRGVLPGDGDIVLSNLKWTNVGRGVQHAGPSELLLRNCRLANTSGSGISNLGGLVRTSRSSAIVGAGGTFYAPASTGNSIFTSFSNFVIDNGARAFDAHFGTMTVDHTSVKNCTQAAFNIGPLAGGHCAVDINSWGNNLDTCVKGFDFTPSGIFPTGSLSAIGGAVQSSNDTISNMTTAAIDITGPNFVSLTGTVGVGNAIGLRLTKGASVQVAASTTLTGAIEVSIDGATTDYATMRAASPKVINNSSYFTKFYE